MLISTYQFRQKGSNVPVRKRVVYLVARLRRPLISCISYTIQIIGITNGHPIREEGRNIVGHHLKRLGQGLRLLE